MKEKNYLEYLKLNDLNRYNYFQKGIEIIRKLTSEMYEAYFVGGVVRDYLLQVPFTDIDIATSCTPEELQKIYNDCDCTFAEYGCVKITTDSFVFDVTTFRVESYETSRKVNSLHFSKKLSEDVCRRDYTVNAMAMTPNLQIIDFYSGQKDVQSKTISIIGDAKLRFTEDPIRIFRGLDLIARFGFHPNLKTTIGMEKTASNLESITPLVFYDSLQKLFDAPFGKKAIEFMNYHDLFSYDDTLSYWMKRINKKYDELTTSEKWGLLAIIKKDFPENSFTHMKQKLMNHYLATCNSLLESDITVDYLFTEDVEFLLSCDKLNMLKDKTYLSKQKEIKKKSKQMPIQKPSELAIPMEELIQNGIEGQYVDTIKNKLLKEVLHRNIDNAQPVLLLRAKEIYNQLKNSLDSEEYTNTEFHGGKEEK